MVKALGLTAHDWAWLLLHHYFGVRCVLETFGSVIPFIKVSGCWVGSVVGG